MSPDDDDRRLDVPRTGSDRVLLIVLVALNVATLIGVPLVGFSVYRLLRQTPPGRYPAWFVPTLFGLLAAFEALLLLRFRGLRRRLARPESGNRSDPP